MPEHDGAAAHEIARERAGGATYDQRSGNHAAPGMITRFAFHDDRAAAHTIAGTIAGVASDNDHPAAHARHFARERAAEPIAGSVRNFDLTALHPGPCPQAHTALDCQSPARHQPPDLISDVTLDHDLAARHSMSDQIEPVAGVFDAHVLRVAERHAKDVADRHATTRRLQLEP